MSQDAIPDLDYFRALFLLAGIQAAKWHELANQYWPPSYTELRAQHPWYLAMTPHGPVRIGWRKRVISINWEDTEVRRILTEDDVTKDETMVHAWSYEKALEYLGCLAGELAKLARAKETP